MLATRISKAPLLTITFTFVILAPGKSMIQQTGVRCFSHKNSWRKVSAISGNSSPEQAGSMSLPETAIHSIRFGERKVRKHHVPDTTAPPNGVLGSAKWGTISSRLRYSNTVLESNRGSRDATLQKCGRRGEEDKRRLMGAIPANHVDPGPSGHVAYR